MNTNLKTGLLSAAIATICGCSGLPERVAPLEQARAEVRRLEQDPFASQVAARELNAAREALQDADNAYRDEEELETIEHLAYIAQRHADVSEQLIAEAHARETIERSELERNRVLLEAREREAARLEEQNRLAEARNLEAEQRNLALAAEAEELQRQAAEAEQRAEEAAQRAQQLETELSDLQAQQTERGLVLTLGDVLFDTGQAALNPGAASTMDRLAQFMRDYGERQVMIEGHTDARGDEQYNIDLSARRATAVRNALLERGIDAQRIRTVGLGESYPVASNDSAVGMQQNRRVEIVISDEQGSFPQGSQRTATR
jgi:outer membrane protein OmpA-like peptidoglycan-associated protein